MIKSWKAIDDSLIIDISHDLFSADLISSNTDRQCDETIIINTNDNWMCELNLLNGESILSIFDTGSTVNLISEDVIENNEYLSTLPILKCPQVIIQNTSTAIVSDKFIEVCFKINENLILHAIALVVQNFGNVKFLLSTKSMFELNTQIDIASKRIIMKKKSFIFKNTYFF